MIKERFRQTDLQNNRVGTANILSLLVAGFLLLFGPGTASAGAWQVARSSPTPGWETWTEFDYGPYASFEAAKTGAMEWCKTVPGYYVDPATDCKIETHPSFPSTITGPGVGHTDPYFGEALIPNPPTSGLLFHGSIWVRTASSGTRPVAVQWPLDTKDGDCPAGQGVDSEVGHGCADKRYHLEKPPEPKDCSVASQPNKSPFHEINPCNPANGNKSQVEIDYSTSGEGAVDFVRTYNSSGPNRTGSYMAPGWRHNYSKQISEGPDRRPQVSISAPSSGQSSNYNTTASDACISGWGEIKNDVYGGDLSAGIPTFAGDNVCEISSGGGTVAYFIVRSGIGWQGYDGVHLPASKQILTRPDGSRIVFEDNGSGWTSKTNPSDSLSYSQSNGWIYKDIHGNQELYSTGTGQLLRIIYATGQQETLYYDSVAGGDSRLKRVRGYFGQEINLYYTNDILSQVSTPDGTIDYTYDVNDNLETVTYPDATVRTYHYEDVDFPTYLTGITDENNDRFATWSYDDAGRAISSEHAGKEHVDLAYNANGTTTLTTANGASRTYTYTVAQGHRKLAMLTGDVCSTCSEGVIADRVYDSNGYLDEVLDWKGNTTQTIRNSRGLTETLIEGKGSTEERTTTTTWHASYALPTQIVSPKNTTTFTHDGSGDVLTATVSSGALSRVWSMTYAGDGRLLTVNGPRTDVSDVTTLNYHPGFAVPEAGQLHTITNALGQVTTYNSYDAAGRPTLITDANGLQTSLTYDWRGNVLTATQTPTVGSPRTTTMTYDDVGQLETLSTPDGMVLTYAYTAAHYLSSITDNLGNHINYDYDAMGNLIDEDTYDSGSSLERAVDYAYDLNNRLDTITNGGFLSDLSFDVVGNLTNEVDPELASTTHSYDALNRLDETIDALTGVIDYDYDDHDNLTSVAAANGATTTYEYDDLDNLTKEISPDRGTIVYTYDEAGNRKTQLDARGKLTSYDYDASNRLTLVTFDDLSTIAYEYDIGLNALGRLNKITDSSGTTTWSYDNFGAVTQKVQTIGAVALTTGYGYDTSGRMSTITYPSGKVVTYTYNTYLPTGVSVGGNTILSAATYDPFGPVNGWTWGNGSFASRDFDLRGVATSIDFAGDTQTLGYDNAGQVISQLDSNLNVLYDYDLLGRLTDFTNNNAGGGGSPSGPMFSAAPVILANIQTAANESGTPPSGNPTPWMTTAVRNVGAASVQLALGRAEVNTGAISVNETVGYIAIEGGANGSFSANGGTVNYEAQTTTDSVRGWGNGCYTTNFLSSFTATPTVVATINKLDGGDGGWARRCSLSSSSVGLNIDEDQYRDTERRHTTEAVGLAAFSQSFDATFNDGVSTWGMEAESVNLPAISGGSNWVSVSFRQTYTTVPVVVVLATNETTDPAAIRVRNVTATGFEAAQVEPANNDGVQGAMTMYYVAAEVGTHELPDGTRILVDTVSISNQQHGGGVTGAESWTTEAFAIWPGASGSSLPASQVMTYDANGNRASLNEDSTLYPYSNLTNSNRLLSTAGPSAKTYTYDLSGNVTGDGVHTYGYDDRGRLVDVDAGSATYVHNGQGQRVKKDNGSVTLFAYDEVGSLIGEYDATGALVQETLWFNGAPVAVLDSTNAYYVHTDQLGSPRTITDGNTVIWRWQSDPFGTSQPDENPDGDANLFTYNLRFPGQYYDVETGLHYNYFRTYDPSTGRYLESDPIGLIGGPNTYSYALLNPISLYDPYGLWVPPSPPQWLVDGAAGFGDTLSFGATGLIRDAAGIDGGVNKCSTAYSAGEWGGIGLGLAAGGAGLARGGLRLELGNFKQGGQWFFRQGTRGPHGHYGVGAGLQTHHLPYQARNWFQNLRGLIGRGEAGADLGNLGLTGYGAAVPASAAARDNDCECSE